MMQITFYYKIYLVAIIKKTYLTKFTICSTKVPRTFTFISIDSVNTFPIIFTRSRYTVIDVNLTSFPTEASLTIAVIIFA